MIKKGPYKNCRLSGDVMKMTSLIYSPFTKMAFSGEDTHVIKFLRQNKHYGANFFKEFPHKSWSFGGLDKSIPKIDRTGTSKRLSSSSRPRTARIADKVEEVETLALSQEDLPQTHRRHTQRQIAREFDISQRTVSRIVKKDLRLICMKKHRAHKLTVSNTEA